MKGMYCVYQHTKATSTLLHCQGNTCKTQEDKAVIEIVWGYVLKMFLVWENIKLIIF
jgi:hypothetical protein